MIAALASRALCRRDHTRDQASEEGHDEFEAGRKHQQRALAGADDRAKPRRERVGGIMQLAEGNGRFLGAAIGQEDIGARVRLSCRPFRKQFDQRGERFYFGQDCLPVVGSGGRTGCAPFGKVLG
jgi:hypothetical protein